MRCKITLLGTKWGHAQGHIIQLLNISCVTDPECMPPIRKSCHCRDTIHPYLSRAYRTAGQMCSYHSRWPIQSLTMMSTGSGSNTSSMAPHSTCICVQHILARQRGKARHVGWSYRLMMDMKGPHSEVLCTCIMVMQGAVCRQQGPKSNMHWTKSKRYLPALQQAGMAHIHPPPHGAAGHWYRPAHVPSEQPQGCTPPHTPGSRRNKRIAI